jgi:hypothetical protein
LKKIILISLIFSTCQSKSKHKNTVLVSSGEWGSAFYIERDDDSSMNIGDDKTLSKFGGSSKKDTGRPVHYFDSTKKQ